MDESSCPRSKPRIPSACFAAAAILLASGPVVGCAPADYGAIDMDASKSVAAEKGIGPQAKPGVVKKKGVPVSMPSAPAPR